MNAHAKIDADTFAAAFVKVQAAIRPAIKGRENGAFKGTRYADLQAVWEAVKEPLQANGFSIIQAPDFAGADMWLTTTILHTSGESMTGRYPLRPSKQDPQGFGSALTYARRYSLSAMLGVIADDDDDGNAASGGNAAQQPQGNITPQQVETILGLIKDTKTDIEKFCAYFKVDCIPAIRASDYERAIAALKGKQK